MRKGWLACSRPRRGNTTHPASRARAGGGGDAPDAHGRGPALAPIASRWGRARSYLSRRRTRGCRSCKVSLAAGTNANGVSSAGSEDGAEHSRAKVKHRCPRQTQRESRRSCSAVDGGRVSRPSSPRDDAARVARRRGRLALVPAPDAVRWSGSYSAQTLQCREALGAAGGGWSDCGGWPVAWSGRASFARLRTVSSALPFRAVSVRHQPATRSFFAPSSRGSDLRLLDRRGRMRSG